MLNGADVRMETPSPIQLAGYLAFLADEPLDEISTAKYEADARSILVWVIANTKLVIDEPRG